MWKKVLFCAVSVLFYNTALAHEGESTCGLCRCRLEERLPEWIALHDQWWGCATQFRAQQVEYGRCLGAVRECERRLTKRQRRRYQPFVEDPNILGYVFPQHPTEDRANNIEASAIEVQACEFQLGSQILPEVLRCSAAYLGCKTVK